MISLKTTIRQNKEGFIPAVLYGEGIKNLNLAVVAKEFLKALKSAGESSLITLLCGKDEFGVLIHDIQRDPLSGKIIHIDFFHPSLKKKIEAEVALVFEGEPMAVSVLGGVLEKEIQHVQVKALARDLPREILVDLSCLNTFQDKMTIGDLKVSASVEILHHNLTDVVACCKEPKAEIIEEKPAEVSPDAAPADKPSQETKSTE